MQTFVDRIFKIFNELKKQIFIKLDILTEENLKETLEKGCKMLHLKFETYDKMD